MPAHRFTPNSERREFSAIPASILIRYVHGHYDLPRLKVSQYYAILMNELLHLVLILSIGFLVVSILGRLALQWSAHRKIRQTFEGNGFSIIRIHRSKAWLDLGAFCKAATSKGYDVTVRAKDGQESEQFCLVRFTPIIRIARSVEPWPSE